MKIFLDDDDENRKTPEGFERVHNLQELAGLLGSRPNEPVEVMSFDNDLGDGTPEGYEIAKWLAENYLERWPKEVRVHSANSSAAPAIRAFDSYVRRHLLDKEGKIFPDVQKEPWSFEREGESEQNHSRSPEQE